jgi:dephospho-CoA kinase
VSDRWPDKLVIGLTGNIAAGKSVVRRMLEQLGAFTIDADALVHRAMAPGAPAYLPIVKTFGTYVLGPDKQIDRQRLGRIAFADLEALALLEGITHPVVGQAIDLLIGRARQQVVVIEAIKLVEAGLAANCDSVWVVDAPPETQLARLTQQRKLTPEDARQRIDAQISREARLSQADIVIDNSNGYEETFRHVTDALRSMTGPRVAEPEPEPEPAPTPPTTVDEVTIRRATPRHVSKVARFITRLGSTVYTADDMRIRFGQKAYMLAFQGEELVGLAGWQVENLIARVDEFIIAPGAQVDPVVSQLAEALEVAATNLQSEIALVFVPHDAPNGVIEAAISAGYEQKDETELRVPDWRRAAAESRPPGTSLIFKRLREDRVLKPI